MIIKIDYKRRIPWTNLIITAIKMGRNRNKWAYKSVPMASGC